MALHESGPLAGHDEVKLFYDTEYYGTGTGGEPLPWHMRVIAGRLGDLGDQQVLDVACGSGGWLAELAARGAKAAGMDISVRAIAACRARLPEADIREGVAEVLPFEAGRFELVTCLGSLEHFIDQPAALKEMRRVAKPEARFLILVPNAGFLTRRLGLYGGTQQAAVRETVRPIAEWRQMLADAGLTVTHTWRDLHPLSRGWIAKGPAWQWPMRAAQAIALAIWPIGWQYQVYFLCRKNGLLTAPAGDTLTSSISN
ncbi:MAG: class I SAM-dependent methyltransferase [Methylococcaceae bacterium]|nr:class I SAM-dependent methyltransferase [Methylococcaceae bacterium]MCI0732550.1 class I SAM-dependent methyltransferase [Methylococcaceae bacterium]